MEKTLSHQNQGPKTFLTALLRASDPESGAKLTLKETIALCTGFMSTNRCSGTNGSIAAADTTAVSLTFTIYHCLANRRVWQRLRDEIRAEFSTADEITGRSTATLHYLDAVIHEGITAHFFSKVGTRLRPAAPSNLIRETPPEGMTVAGYFIPGKVVLLDNVSHRIDISEYPNLDDLA